MTTPSPIRSARLAAGLSREELAARAGLSLGWLATVERCPDLASRALLLRLAEILAIDPAVLLARRSGPGMIW